MLKTTDWFKRADLRLFRHINRRRERAFRLFSYLTHLGGSISTIGFTLMMAFASYGLLRRAAIVSLIALTLSHLPVALIKRRFPRIRPHLALEKTETGRKPLIDPSFPSGHSTAIFSVLIPYVLWLPVLGFLLVPLAISVSASRIVLGLHYPSDCLVGALLGTLTAMLTFSLSI